jgi:hypothetical protein
MRCEAFAIDLIPGDDFGARGVLGLPSLPASRLVCLVHLFPSNNLQQGIVHPSSSLYPSVYLTHDLPFSTFALTSVTARLTP